MQFLTHIHSTCRLCVCFYQVVILSYSIIC